MKIIIRNRDNHSDSFVFKFDSKVTVNTGKFRSLDELVTLKDIEKEVRDYLNIPPYYIMIIPGILQTIVTASDDVFNRIKTIIVRNSIIENILKDDDK
jgi:hypothetical protein